MIYTKICKIYNKKLHFLKLILTYMHVKLYNKNIKKTENLAKITKQKERENMRKIISMMLVTTMALSVTACGSGKAETTAATDAPKAAETIAEKQEASETQAEAEAASAELKKVGVAFMKTDPFMVPLYDGMKAECDANGIELIAYYADNDIEKQISQVDDLLQQDIDGLIVMPVDFEGITPALEAADKAGVPVVSVDAECAKKDLTIAYIASDNYAAGYACGENVLKTLDSAKIVALTHPEIKCTIDRYQGFKDAIEGHDGYEIIAEQPCSGLMDKGMTVMDNMIQAYPEFDVAFCINDGSSQGAISSLEAANRLGGVQVYAVDGQQANADLIKAGKLTGEAAQQPYKMGQGAVELLIKNSKGEPFEYENLLEINFLTNDNVEGYEGF